MNAHGKDGRIMPDMTITARKAETEPKYRKTAAELLKCCREFYQNPENERAFQKWKNERRKEA